MKRYFSLALCILWMALIFAPSAAQAVSKPIGAIHEEKGLSLDSIDELFSLVKNEFVDEVSTIVLVNSALKNIKIYLKTQKLDDSYVKEIQAGSSPKAEIEKFNQIYKQVQARNPKLSKETLSYAAIRGLLKGLNDPYSVFLDPKEYANLLEQMKGGTFGGIGIFIELDKEKNNQLTIIEAMEGTPGQKAGIQSGDMILKVDGKTTKGVTLNDAQRMLRGDVGSKVILTIGRPGVEKPFDLEIIRDTIHVKTIAFKMIDGDIGYIKLRLFGENTGEELREALEDLDTKGARGYILDLRNNGGGYVNAALNVCSEFLATGSKIVTIIKKGNPDLPYVSSPNLRSKVPVVNLVNKYSASASEITAGALQDHKAGIVMGTKTFGKASVQKIFPLPNKAALKVTTARYVTPKGRNINKKGINPDVKVEDGGPNQDRAQDVQLEAAKKLAREKIKEQEASVKEHTAFADSVYVRTLQEQYDYIKKHYGDDAKVLRSTLIYKKGQLYDQVIIKGSGGTGEKTLIFHIQDLL
jgi:carboxyl-terminal processing protease